MKKAARQSGQLELFGESISHGGIAMEIFIFDGAGNRLATCDGWQEAEVLIKAMQADGHGTLEARNFIQPRPPENIEYNRQPMPMPEFESVRQLVGPTWVNLSEEMRWRCNYGN